MILSNFCLNQLNIVDTDSDHYEPQIFKILRNIDDSLAIFKRINVSSIEGRSRAPKRLFYKTPSSPSHSLIICLYSVRYV